MGTFILIFSIGVSPVQVVPQVFATNSYCREAGNNIITMWGSKIVNVSYVCLPTGIVNGGK